LERKDLKDTRDSKPYSSSQKKLRLTDALTMSRKAYFNEIAETWDEKYCTPELITFLKRLVSNFGLKPGQKILDVGTGTGVLIPLLSKAVGIAGSITAIDYAENMVKVCRSKYSHIRNVAIKLQDVEDLYIPSESFDAITCFGLFPHLEDKVKALNNMYRALKPGGKLIIAHSLSSKELGDHHNNASPAVMHDLLPERPEMMHLLKSAQFINVYIKDEPGCYLCLSKKPDSPS
jgi:demethylmenaquinone methyltransferase/2-methoxy-6-polyprenyl-1,4-benzoquinol methylase